MKSSKSRKSRGPSKTVVERGFRVADQIQRDLANLLRDEVKDPRIGFLTVTEVEVSPDYAHAKVFYTVLPDEPEQLLKTAEGLAACRGFLRAKLGKLLQIHQTPELHFVHDQSVAKGAYLSQIIDEANRLSNLTGSEPTPPTEA